MEQPHVELAYEDAHKMIFTFVFPNGQVWAVDVARHQIINENGSHPEAGKFKELLK